MTNGDIKFKPTIKSWTSNEMVISLGLDNPLELSRKSQQSADDAVSIQIKDANFFVSK